MKLSIKDGWQTIFASWQTSCFQIISGLYIIYISKKQMHLFIFMHMYRFILDMEVHCLL